jgi:hypothetical protein
MKPERLQIVGRVLLVLFVLLFIFVRARHLLFR